MHNYFFFLLYGGDPMGWKPLLSLISFILYGGDPMGWKPLLSLISFSFYILHHLQWSVRRTFGCEQTHKFCLIKVSCYLAGRFDNILFNWAIINFFLIEYYVRAYWISYVEFVFQNKITFSQFCGNYDVCPHFNNVDSLNPAADRWALHPCLTSRAIKISPRYV